MAPVDAHNKMEQQSRRPGTTMISQVWTGVQHTLHTMALRVAACCMIVSTGLPATAPCQLEEQQGACSKSWVL
jgi:hypothetical protein